MFDRIKKAFSGATTPITAPAAAPSSVDLSVALSTWASTHGIVVDNAQSGSVSLKGLVNGKAWRLDSGPASRDFIEGAELKGRAELDVSDAAVVVVMSRTLKDALEKRAYSAYTDDTQTLLDPKMPEEMRWLALYPEARADHLSRAFSSSYTVLADQQERAAAWLDEQLAQELLEWPDQYTPRQPFVLAVMRGRVYLRMQYTPNDLATLQHAAQLLASASTTALAVFRRR